MPLTSAVGDPGPFLIIFLVVAVVIAVVVIAAIQGAKRRQAWQTLAMRLGCSYSADDPFGIDTSYPHSLFQKGHSQCAYNVMSGRLKEREIMCFDYLYKETHGSGKNRHTTTYYHTCLLLALPIRFQTLSIRPESFLDRVGEFFGLDDIDFESDEFSRKFFVKCADKKFAYDVIHPRVMELLLQCGKVHVEAVGDSILFYCTPTLRVPEEVEPLVQRGLQFVELIPDYLIEQAKGAI